MTACADSGSAAEQTGADGRWNLPQRFRPRKLHLLDGDPIGMSILVVEIHAAGIINIAG